MQIADEVLRNATLVVLVIAGFLAFRAWRRGNGAPAAWAAGAFISLSAIAAVGRFFPEDPEGLWWDLAVKVLLSVILVFPWLVYRFATAFEAAPKILDRAAATLTLATIAATLLIPRFPGRDEPRPTWLLAFTALIIVQWTLLFATAGARLWRAGGGQPTVARRRMRMLALASIGMNLVIIASGIAPADEGSAMSLAIQSLTLISAIGFGLGLGLPRILRVLWRQNEQRAMLNGISRLLTATSPEEVTETLLPNAAAIVGAPTASVVDRRGEVIAMHPRAAQPSDGDAVRIPLKHGELRVHTGPYTPFFGAEELDLLASFGALADLALERATLFQREQAFIANAAHELRTPLSVLSGLTSTLHARWEDLPRDRLSEVLAAMDRQGERATELINRLLDIAYIEHGGMDLTPVEVVAVIERSVESAPPPDTVTVTVEAAEGIKAMAESQRLEQILTNLLVNAYRHGGPNVTVEAHVRADHVELSITDDGPGIPEDVAPHIFEPFTRSRTAKGPGSGLGLAISARIAEAFGGRLVHDRSGPGTRFVLSLRAA